MIKTFDQIIKEIGQNIFQPVYFLCGDESYYIDQIADEISDKTLTQSEKDINQYIIYGKDTTVTTVREIAMRYPMFSKYNLILLREAQELKKIDEFKSYFENPNPVTILVILYKYGKPDKRTTFYKIIENHSCLFISEKLKDAAITKWIEKYISDKGLKISPTALTLITEYMNNDLSLISNQLQKLTMMKKEGSTIDTNDIEQNIGISREYNVFELQKALAVKNTTKLVKIFNYMSTHKKDNPIQATIAVLFTFFSKCLVLQQGIKNASTVANEIKILPYFIADYETAIRNYPQKLNKVLLILQEYDLKSKGVNSPAVEDAELLKEMLFRILSV